MNYLLAMILVPLLLGGWLLVMRLGRRYAKDHPEFGRFRELGGCGVSCGCGLNSCRLEAKGSAQPGRSQPELSSGPGCADPLESSQPK